MGSSLPERDPRQGSAPDHRPPGVSSSRRPGPRPSGGPPRGPPGPQPLGLSGSGRQRRGLSSSSQDLSASSPLVQSGDVSGSSADARWRDPTQATVKMPTDASGELLESAVLRAGPTGGLVGRRVGPYRVGGLIAQGGMGAVYEAQHERLDRPVALKTLLLGRDAPEEDVQRFLREAHAAARLSHPNLVPIHDVGEANGVRYLAMELIRGETLHALIRRAGHVDERVAIEFIVGAARGLAHAHAQGVLHRDLKPANVLVQEDGVARVTDFGVAKAAGHARLTATGTALGTPAYMSPEQAMGLNEELDARTDIYGLGAILYECLTGRPPFNAPSHVATMQAVVNDPPLPLRQLRADVSRDLEAICLKCLEKRPEDRYGSCDELVSDLEACLRGRTIRARIPGFLTRAARRARRNAAIAALAVLATGSLAALGITLVQPLVRARRLARLEAASVERAGERLAALAAEVDAASTVEELRGVRTAAEVERLEAWVVDELEAADDPARRESVASGVAAGDDLRARSRAVRAAASLRLAELAGSPASPAALRLLTDAELLDPQGPAGRQARLTLARVLLERPGRARRRLAALELEELARGQGRGVEEARRLLAEIRAGQGSWDEALGLLASLDEASLGPEERRRVGLLRELGAVLAPGLRLPAWRGAAAGADGLRLTHGDVVAAFAPPLEGWRDGSRLLELDRGTPLLERVRAWELTAGPAGELFVEVQKAAGWEICLLEGATLVPWWSGPDRPVHAVGDVDGDGRGDLVVSGREYSGDAQVFLGGRERRPLALFGSDPQRETLRYVARIALVDLDGDRRDEVVTALRPIISDLVRVEAFDPEGLTFVSRGAARVGAVHGLVPYDAGQGREGLLAVSDTALANERILERLEGASPEWLGRDGVYRLELGGDGFGIVGRWTYGPDRPLTRAELDGAARVDAFLLPLGGEPHVVRTAQVDGRWRLELAELAALERSGATASFALELTEPPPRGRRLVAELDGDPSPEMVQGDHLLGLGPPRRAAPGLPQGEPSAAARLGRAVQRLLALGQDGPARERLAQLEAEHADAPDAADALLAVAEEQIERAAEVDAQAEAAYAAGDADSGGRRWEEARHAYAQAAERCEALAQRTGVAPVLRARAWAKAAHAHDRAGQPGRSAQALREALEDGVLGRDWSDRLGPELSMLEGLADPEVLELGPDWSAALGQLQASAGLTVRGDGGGLALHCGPAFESWAGVPVVLEGDGALTLEAVVRIEDAAWATPVRIGIFSDASSRAATGFELRLWDVHTLKLTGAALVDGVDGAPALLGALGARRLRLRAELRPRAGGETAVRLVVREADDDRLLLARDVVLPGPLPRGELFVGLGSPRHGNRDEIYEHPYWGPFTTVLLERIAVGGRRARLGVARGGIRSAHGALARGDGPAALELYAGLLGEERAAAERAEALLHRGCARALAGEEPTLAGRDVAEAVAVAPYDALLWLEDAAEPLLGRGLELAAVDAGVRELASSERPLLRLIGRSLRAEHMLPSDWEAARDELLRGRRASEVSHEGLALIYVALRERADSSASSAEVQALVETYRRAVPDGRFPYASYGAVIRRADGGEGSFLERVADLRCHHHVWSAAYMARSIDPAARDALALQGVREVVGQCHASGIPHLEAALAGGGPPLSPKVELQLRYYLGAALAAVNRLERALDEFERAVALGLPRGALDRVAPLYGDSPRFQALRAR